jgi:hypothetical protein
MHAKSWFFGKKDMTVFEPDGFIEQFIDPGDVTKLILKDHEIGSRGADVG